MFGLKIKQIIIFKGFEIIYKIVKLTICYFLTPKSKILHLYLCKWRLMSISQKLRVVFAHHQLYLRPFLSHFFGFLNLDLEFLIFNFFLSCHRRIICHTIWELHKKHKYLHIFHNIYWINKFLYIKLFYIVSNKYSFFLVMSTRTARYLTSDCTSLPFGFGQIEKKFLNFNLCESERMVIYKMHAKFFKKYAENAKKSNLNIFGIV